MPVTTTTRAKGTDMDVNERYKEGLLTETHEKVRNVHHVRGVSSGGVIHFVLFPRLILDNIQKDVDRRLSVP